MKKLIYLFTLAILFSCNRTEPCPYNVSANCDTTFFISFKFDNKSYHYYQHRYDNGGISTYSGLKIDNMIVYNTEYRVSFDDPQWNGAIHDNYLPGNHPLVQLDFFDSIMIDKDRVTIFPIPLLSESLSENYKFTTTTNGLMPSTLPDFDVSFFPRLNIDLFVDNIEYSTMLLGEHFGYSSDSLDKYLWRSSSFEITSMENVCSSKKLVTGTFNTTVMDRTFPVLHKIEDGYFKILIE